MDKIVIYSLTELNAIAKAATAGRRDEVWLADMRAKIADMVKARPAAYRTFGPWWWPLKAQLVAAGLLSGDVMPALVEAISTGHEVLDMAGAVAYHGYNVDQMRNLNVYTVNTESGDTMEYLLHDDDVEALIAGA